MVGRLNDPKFLVGNWPLNGHADDISGHGNNGIWTGTEAYSEDNKSKLYANLDGSSYVYADNIIPATGDFSITIKVNTDDFAVDSDQIAFANNFTSGGEALVLYANTSLGTATNQIRLFLLGSERYVGPSISNTGVRHLTLTKLGTTYKLYLDKTLKHTFSDTGSPLAQRLDMGASVSSTFYLTTNMGDCKLYNVGLTDSEVKQLHNQPTPNKTDKMTASLESDGSDDYIDTGVACDSNTEVEVLADLLSLTNDKSFIGSRKSAGTDYYGITLFNSGMSYLYGTGTYTTSIYTYTPGNKTGIMKAAIKSDGYYYNDVKVSPLRGSQAMTGQPNMTIGCRNNAGTPYGNVNAKFFYVKIWQGGELVRHFTPQSDGTFYDWVEGKTYSNDGTGTLVYKNEPLNLTDDSIVFETYDGVKDLSRNQTNITNTDTITGKDMVFNGISSKLITDNFNLSGDDATISVIAILNDVGATVRPIVANGDDGNSTSNGQFYFDIYVNKTRWKIGTMVLKSDTTPIAIGIPYHFDMVKVGADAYLYINGELVDQATCAGFTDELYNFNIGARQIAASTWDEFLDGSVKKVIVRNRALSADEIKINYLKSRVYN